MIRDDRQRLWIFSRGERMAIIVLIVAIIIALGVRAWVRCDEPTTIVDTTWIECEIPQFEKQLEQPAVKKKKTPKYTPKKQILIPVEQDLEKL